MAITKIVTQPPRAAQSEQVPLRKVWDIQDRPPVKFRPINNEGWQTSKGTPEESAIVIDNGTSAVKAGWSFDKSPHLSVIPATSRYKDRRWARTYQFVGEDIFADQTAKSNMRQAFQGGGQIVSNWDVMEGVLDYIFIKLGIDSEEDGINRPVIITEPVANLAFSRNLMTELMFECYSARSLAFGIDSLFSYDYNGGRTGLVVSSSYSATHFIPVIEGKPLLSNASRLNWGRASAADFLLKLIYLKYPYFPGKWSRQISEQALREHSYVSQNYPAELTNFLDWSGLEERDHVLQFPYTEHTVVEKTAEELEAAAERRKEGGRRLQEQAAKMRQEKMMKKEQELEYYKKLQNQSDTLTPEEFEKLLESNDFDTEAELHKVIKKHEDSLKRSRLRDLGEEVEEHVEVPTFPLLDIPDADLDADMIRVKRQQRLAKNSYDARMRAKAEKEAERKRNAEEERLDREKRENDFDLWSQEYRARRELLIQKIADKARMKSEIGNRKSHASQMRMKTLANLAADNPKKRKRGGGGDEDDFGRDDSDWGVYRDVAQGGTGASDDEDEEDLDAALKTVEAALLEHDSTFTEEDTVEGRNRSNWSRSLFHAFLRGPRPFDGESVAEQHQVHLNVERIRVPEVLFQPPIAGVDQAGIVETIADIATLRLSDRAQGTAILKDVFLTGGNVTFPGLDTRLRSDLLSELPIEAELRVRRAKDPILDAWRGAAQWMGTSQWRQASVTKQEYSEKGVDYLKEHNLGNAY